MIGKSHDNKNARHSPRTWQILILAFQFFMFLAGSIFLTTTMDAAGAEMEGLFCEIFQERAIKVNQRVAQSELLEFLEVHAEVDCLEKNYVLEWSVRNQFLREITSIRKSMRNHLLNMMCASDAGWESAFEYGWTSKYDFIDQNGRPISSIVVNGC